MNSKHLILCAFTFFYLYPANLQAQEIFLEETGEVLPMNFFQQYRGKTYTATTAEGTRIFHFSEKQLLTYRLSNNKEIDQAAVLNMPEDYTFGEFMGALSDNANYTLYLKSGNSIKGLHFNFENKKFEYENYGRLWKGQIYLGSIADQKGLYILTLVRKTKDFVLHSFHPKQEPTATDLIIDNMPMFINGKSTDKPYFDPDKEAKKGTYRLGVFNPVPGIQEDRPTPISSVTANAKMYLEDNQLRIVMETGDLRASSIVVDRSSKTQELFFIDYPAVNDFISTTEDRSNSYYRDGVLYYLIGNKDNVGIADLNLTDYSQSFQTHFGQDEEVADYYLADLDLPSEEKKEGNGKELKLKRTLRRVFRSNQTGIKVIESNDQRYISLGGYTMSSGTPMMVGAFPGGVAGSAGVGLFFGFSTSFERALSLDLIMDKSSGKQELKEFEEAFEGMDRFLEDERSKWDFRFIDRDQYLLGYYNRKTKSMQFREFRLR